MQGHPCGRPGDTSDSVVRLRASSPRGKRATMRRSTLAGRVRGRIVLVPSWILLLVSLGYAALLFGVAWWGDRRPLYPDRPWLRPVVYSLALAVYCSSWTFYGGVGSAVRYGVGYLPIYLGPLLMLIFGWRIIERLALIARSENVVSIADFISSRFGRSRRLAALVALIALVGV